MGPGVRPPRIREDAGDLVAQDAPLGRLTLTVSDAPTPLFCDNETNARRLCSAPGTPYSKDGINDHVVAGAATVNPEHTGTKASL